MLYWNLKESRVVISSLLLLQALSSTSQVTGKASQLSRPIFLTTKINLYTSPYFKEVMWEITNEKGLEFIQSIFFNKIGFLHMLTRIYFKYFARDGKDKNRVFQVRFKANAVLSFPIKSPRSEGHLVHQVPVTFISFQKVSFPLPITR